MYKGTEGGKECNRHWRCARCADKAAKRDSRKAAKVTNNSDHPKYDDLSRR